MKLNGLNNYIILKGEKVCAGRKICDFIIFARNDRVIIGIVELKSKTIHANEIKQKLTNGSEIALDILEKNCGKQIDYEIYHLVLCKSWHPSEYKAITSRKITLKGKKYFIIPKRCGSRFSEIISG